MFKTVFFTFLTATGHFMVSAASLSFLVVKLCLGVVSFTNLAIFPLDVVST